MRVDSPTIGKSAVRLCLAIAASKKWIIQTTDVKSAFLQGNTLERSVFILPPKEERTNGRVWRLKKCLYGLNDAARQFYISLADELQKIGCVQSQLEPTLYYKLSDGGQLQGMILTHVDDLLHCGEERFDRDVMNPLRNRFVSGKVDLRVFKYVGLKVIQKEHCISLDQTEYMDKLVTLPGVRGQKKTDELTPEQYSQFRSVVGSLNWGVAGTRPDLAFDLLEHSTKFRKATVDDLSKVNKTVVKGKSMLQILYPELGESSEWSLVLFSDASHANLPDGVSSSLGYVIFLTGKDDRCCPVNWRANKIKRVVRSTLAAEALALVEGLEEMLYIQSMLVELGIFTSRNSLTAIVDNMSLRDAVYSTKLVDDKRLRIDVASLKQSLERKDIHAIKWCSGEKQLANCLTKRGACCESLRTVFQTGKLFLSDY